LCPRVPLGPGYRDFADKRSMLGIPNALDVLSNIPFLIAGLWGTLWLLSATARSSFVDSGERLPYLVFFAGVTLTGIGSLWYHLSPSNSRLPWDLLPMTCSFLSMLVAVFMERINVRVGLLALAPLLLLGLASVAYWYISAALGQEDYKFYLFVQFFPPMLLALIVVLYRCPISTTLLRRYLLLAFSLFIAAKLFELLDSQIFAFGNIASGHMLKHITAGVSCYCISRMPQVRRPLPSPSISRHQEEFHTL
jgi:hypothetical protein